MNDLLLECYLQPLEEYFKIPTLKQVKKATPEQLKFWRSHLFESSNRNKSLACIKKYLIDFIITEDTGKDY